MSQRKEGFLGTPLSGGSNESRTKDLKFFKDGTRSRQREYVTDNEGRRRFHGAFTGGFSAGLYNTVDTTSGFTPKSFVTHRIGRSERGSSTAYDHRPEDYMDEEDFSEFGIAPKKIRLKDCFSDNQIAQDSNIFPGKATPAHIGERILKRMTGGRIVGHLPPNPRFDKKTDYYGLGHTSLMKGSDFASAKDIAFTSSNPLVAILKGGRKIAISGQAFGEGVLCEDDQSFVLDEYGLDNIESYSIPRREKQKHGTRHKQSDKDWGDARLNLEDNDGIQIPGFNRDGAAEHLFVTDLKHLYTPPVIPSDWSPPRRSLPYIPPKTRVEPEEIQLCTQGSKNFGDKFTPSGSVLKSETSTLKSGLLSYRDLKAQESRCKTISQKEPTDGQQEQILKVVREVLEWHPCSLLCKHFNVPNPYPGLQFCGVKPRTCLKGKDSLDGHDQNDEADRKKLAPIEFRRSVFGDTFVSSQTVTIMPDESSEDEDKPQVIQLD